MNYQEQTDKDLKVLFTEKLKTNSQWQLKALVAIFNKQTADEQMVHETKHDNGVGFTGSDAKFLTSLAAQYQRKGFLSPKQTKCLSRSMPKYAGQLVKIVKGKI